MSTLPNLASLTDYRHPRVIEKFKRDFPHLAQEADHLFVELMKYLWLGQKHFLDRQQNPEDQSLNFLLAIYDDMVNVDHMWHCFILTTREYEAFCHRFFGRFIHHIPDALDELPPTKEQFAEDLEKFVAYVYDNLGADTVRTWFGLSA